MPAQRVGDGVVVVRKFDVVGEDSGTTPEFIRHVGLAGEDRAAHAASDSLPWEHMGPPLRRGDSRSPIHALGSSGLSVDQTLQISTFIDELENEYQGVKARNQYVVIPHAHDEKALDGTTKYRKFSCAGFVIEAYRDAAIELIRTNAEDLPEVDLETLVRQYPDQEPELRNPRLRARIGLGGDGPWRAVLAGYLLNSLARPEPDIHEQAYQPKGGDEFFPSRRP